MPSVTTAISIASAAGVPVYLNPAPARPLPPGLLDAVSVVIVNEVEAAMLGHGADHAARARSLAGPSRTAVVTLGAAGGLHAGPAGEGRYASLPVDALDTVGAGDCFCAALAVARVSGAPLDAALAFAAAAAAVSVTRPGAVASLPTAAEVAALLGSPS
jgi:ribokinase